MKRLNYDVLKENGYSGFLLRDARVKVLQFGEGAFLRAFADAFFDLANEKAGFDGKIAMVQPASRNPEGADRVNAQDGLYTLYLRGIEDGRTVDRKRVISAASCCLNAYRDWDRLKTLIVSPDLEYIVSNTTEAGIVYNPQCRRDDAPPESFPAKLATLLYERFLAGMPGLALLPCELIDDNGKALRDCVLRHASDWSLGGEFEDWIREECVFCSTLVDRIVSGRVRNDALLSAMEEENGYRDELIDVGEVFGVWYIEAPGGRGAGSAALARLEQVFGRAGANVRFVPEVSPYKKRKVRILNGAHTGFVPGAFLAGYDIVRDCMNDSVIRGFLDRMLKTEIIPVLPLPGEDCLSFAAAVKDRFANPFVDHALLSIALNSTAKFRARNLPSLLEYHAKYGKLPRCLVMSFAMLIAFYSSDIRRREEGALICRRTAGGAEEEYPVKDDAAVLDCYEAHRSSDDAALVRDVLKDTGMWGQDLTKIEGLERQVAEDLALIRREGARAAFAGALED